MSVILTYKKDKFDILQCLQLLCGPQIKQNHRSNLGRYVVLLGRETPMSSTYASILLHLKNECLMWNSVITGAGRSSIS